MAIVVNCVLVLLVSASALAFVGFSSAKPSFSISSISPQCIYPEFGFSSAIHSSSFRLIPAQCISPEFDNENILAKVIEVKNELAQSKEEIEKLRAVMESKLTNLDKVLNSLKKINQEHSVKPIPENQSIYEELVSEGIEDKKRKRNDGTSERNDSQELGPEPKKPRRHKNLNSRDGML